MRKAYGYMNNHADAKSVANAIELKQFLDEPIEGDYHPPLVERYPQLAGVARTTTPRDLLEPVRER